MNKSTKTLLVIGGPTAVGKTTMAIEIARALDTEIVSADSRQLFAELNIGVARPSEEELAAVKHHLIATQPVAVNYNAGMYEQQALQTLEHLFKQYDVLVMVGGSGLYIDAVVNGLDQLPEADQELRNSLNTLFNEEGITALQEKLLSLDPHYYNTVDLFNHRRIIRALEVSLLSGRPYSSFTAKEKTERPFRVKYAVIDLPRPHLYERVEKRVDQMLEMGLLSEAESLIPLRNLNALRTVGYTELFDYFDGKTSLEEAVALIKQNTRRYAKRQLTWFRRIEEAKWFSPGEADQLLDFLQ